jgi:DNA invertase Pin-like site-specific DNA recombinase
LTSAVLIVTKLDRLGRNAIDVSTTVDRQRRTISPKDFRILP